ncbi:MAG TPA: mannitol dehydrogenase family protein [Kineosporiaceae bacterium]|nr:mannitol dehydrogenase family protein [Kineosporiaceae bacterium]
MTQLRGESLAALGAGIAVPGYRRDQVSVGIVHFGVGGFHRSHQAMYLDQLMNAGQAMDWGICGVGLLPSDRRMSEVMRTQDCLYTLVLKLADGTWQPRVIGSIVDYLFAPDDPEAVLARLTSATTKLVSLTITEGGYNIDLAGRFVADAPAVVADLTSGAAPTTVFGFIVEALARRRALGLVPFSVMSCDNIQGNGHVAEQVITAFARLRDPELAEWIATTVDFPNSMVDRITPATTDADRSEITRRFGIEDEWPVLCEPFQQWVLEDTFRAGRPPFEAVGVQLVKDVEPYELMKLRLLNAGHQALAYAGYLSGYRLVHEAAQDPLITDLLLGYMREEAVPTLLPVPGIDLPQYCRELIERFANPEVADTVARLCGHTSDLIPKFLLPVLRRQLDLGGPIERATMVLACWARYAEGIDEQGEPIEVVDALKDRLMASARRQADEPLAFLQNRDVFGDLVDDERLVAGYTTILASLHEHGVRETLRRSATKRLRQ